MQTVTNIFTTDYRVKGSKFLGNIFPCGNETEAEEALQNIKSEHPAATHHCYAYICNPHRITEFSSDDGEPGGTAGLPILNTLRSRNLMNVLLIVVRYYGGTKLGKSGLIDAYTHSAELTIESSVKKKLIPIKTFKITYDYPQQNQIDKLKNNFTWIELDSVYLEKVVLEFGCPISETDRFESRLQTLRHLFDEIEYTGNSFHVVE
jgi:uncharacterized YigZ family protein